MTITSSTVLDLIARLEAALTEGSRELDGLIAVLIRPGFYPSVGIAEKDAPHYTTSLDAAVPGENIVEMYRFGPDLKFRVRHSWGDGRSAIGEHKSEAIARRIAALKARE